jgi:formate dehydrogenase assembly factor FdhD
VVVSDRVHPQIDRALAVVSVCRIAGSGSAVCPDVLAVEEPLEIRLDCAVDGRRSHRGVSITMRTPGHDDELAIGFLFTEGIITAREQVTGVRACGAGNVVRVDLRSEVAVDLTRLERHFYTASSFTLNRLKRGNCHVSFPIDQTPANFPAAVQSRDAGEGVATARRHRHRGRLPLLRRRLRAAHVHQGRRTHQH